MIRQLEENSLNPFLSEKEAREVLRLTRYKFRKVINSGEIAFKEIGGTLYFQIEDLHSWQRNTVRRTDYSKETVSTTHTSLSLLKQDKEFSLERRLEEYRKQKQQNIASNALKKYRRRVEPSPTVSCLA